MDQTKKNEIASSLTKVDELLVNHDSKKYGDDNTYSDFYLQWAVEEQQKLIKLLFEELTRENSVS